MALLIRQFVAFLCSVFMIVTVGCQTNDLARNDQVTPNTPRKINYQTTEQTRRSQPGITNMKKTADRLANLATRVPGVSQATVIVVGPYTLVGIDVNKKLDRGRVGTIKYSVAQALKKDPRGKNALITADVDIVQRLRELNQEIARGKPMSGIMDELAEIAGRIAPQPSNTR